MIYYFSGTGNSRYVAEQLAKLTGDVAVSIFGEVGVDAEVVGLVFPVYGWAPPQAIMNFARQMPAPREGEYRYAVMTCGDDAGKTVDVLRTTGFSPQSAFSVIMPNTYVCLPGFNVDNDSLRKKKLQSCGARIEHIAENIRRKLCITDVHEGALPRTKTYLLGRFFAKFLITDSKFRVNINCNACGACAKACPVENICFENNRPAWSGNCMGCLACYHTCPRHAINFGSQTLRKGQYTLRRYIGETGNGQK